MTDCSRWTGHTIVCGLDGVGLRTVEQLHLTGARVAVIDEGAPRRLAQAVDGWGIPRITGDSRLVETLAAAGLPGAAAVVCAQDDDLHTLETALLARERRPDARVVAQVRNPAVGRALAGIDVSVLDVAGLTAPSIVEACLRTGVHDIPLAGEPFSAAQTVATAEGTLRSRYGDLAPLAVVPVDGGDLVVCPGRDQPVRPGDRVTLFGGPGALEAAGIEAGGAATAARRARRAHRATVLRHFLISLLTALDRRIAVAVGALAVLLVAATALLDAAYREPGGARMSWIDALYFTVETIATVGYGDFSFREQPTWLRLCAVVLMVLGAMLATIFFALLTNVLVSRRIEESMGRRRVTGLAGHVVVVGLGSIGARVVELLVAAGQDVVVVERDESNRYLAQIRQAGVPVIIADATLPQTLAAVNLATAAAVAVLTSDDLVNLETGLAVKDQLGDRWLAVPVVLRLFDRQLARTVQRSFGFANVRSTAALAAPWFVGGALGLDVLGTFYVGDRELLVGRLAVAPGGGLDGLAMADLSARTRVVAIGRAGGLEHPPLEHPPRRGTRFQAGDLAYLIGPYEELLAVLRRDSLSPKDVAGTASPPKT